MLETNAHILSTIATFLPPLHKGGQGGFFYMTHIHNRPSEEHLRQQLRSNMPTAEVLLWSKLRGRQLLGHKFRRQYSVGPYVVDFYCPALRLAIELDGDSHFAEGAAKKDEVRRRFIESFGIRIVRFLNTDVYENMDGLLDTLVREMELSKKMETEKEEPPLPPLVQGGE